jgi:NTE family protein
MFTPAEVDGRVLSDGGLLDNIPTDVAKEMGADIIVAVNVGTPLGTCEEIEMLGGVLLRAIDVATIQSDRRNLKLADFVITPDLGRYTRFDFDAAEAIIELGYRSAEAQGAQLLRLALRPGSHLATGYNLRWRVQPGRLNHHTALAAVIENIDYINSAPAQDCLRKRG